MQLFVSRASGFVSGGVCKSCAAFSDIPVCTDAERGDVPCLWVARLWRETQNPRINHGMLSVGRNLPPSRVPQGLIQPGLEVTWEWISGSYWHLVETKIQMQTELELNPSFEVILNFLNSVLFLLGAQAEVLLVFHLLRTDRCISSWKNSQASLFVELALVI